MELDLQSLWKTSPGSKITAAYDLRAAVLAELPLPDFQPSLPTYGGAARSLLVQQRKSKRGYQQPEQQTRHKFRTKGQKAAKCNEDMWIFTKHEVARAFDRLLSRAPLARPDIAQALLSYASVTSLDELWCHLHDPKLEKRLASRVRRSRSSVIPEPSWLDKVTGQENLEYIRLMCQAGFGQEALDRAFRTALSKHSMDAMEVLLGFGAVASACQDALRERFRLHDDIALARLLLSVPNAMSVEAWRYCVEPEAESLHASGKQSLTILLLCLAHRPDVGCGLLLLKALKSQNLQATAIILAFADREEISRDLHRPACELASRVEDDGRRHEFFTMLAESGFVADGLVLRQELMKDVKAHHLPLIQLLADAGVGLDIEPHNAVYWAVSHMDLDILELFKSGTFSSPVSLALKLVPDSTSEPDMLRLVEIFAPRGLAGEPLDAHLVRAVRKQHIQLIDSLLRCGASVEFGQASAIQTALQKANLDILSILLRGKCSPQCLSVTIPTAMVLHPRPRRLQAMKALAEKGVLNQELGVPLQRLVSEDDPVDSELVQLLLQHQAPVDNISDDANNAVLIAAQRGRLSVLKMLCHAGPRNETLSKAVPIAFDVRHTSGYDVALETIKLLLQEGAAGLPIDQTLLTAAKQDDRLDIVDLLIDHGADANYASGAAFAVALKSSNFKLLEVLCARCPPSQASTKSVLFTAIDPMHYQVQALELLLVSIPSAASALNALWDSDKFRGNENMTAILPCFLRHGLDVDLGNGVLLCFAIQEQNILLLGKILSENPSITSLTTAFRATTSVQPRNVELEAMRLLLEKSESAEIGQSESLLQQTHAALTGDFAGLQLLLRHQAVVDFDEGRAFKAAANAGSLKVLDMLLSVGPAASTLRRACLAAASSAISCDQKNSVFEHLLAANGGISADDLSKLLADSVASLPNCTQLPRLLLARGAKVNVETLKVALEDSCHDLFVELASSIQSSNTVILLFRQARKTKMVNYRRYWIYHYLLARGIPSDDVSEALLDCLKADDLGDLSFPKLLLENGAAAGYKNGEAFALALGANSLEAVKLLSQYPIDDSIAGATFDLARKTKLLEPHVRLGVYRCLLQWNISKSSKYQALMDTLSGGHSDISLVELLLANGVDPNENEAHCFVVASSVGAQLEFRALSKHAKLSVVVKALLDHVQNETEVVQWFSICLQEQPHPTKINEDELLFQCLRKFPQATTLLKLLLDNGVSASAKVTHRLCAGWEPEPCTALVWALFSTPRIANDAILMLLDRGGNAALPAYSTPLTKVSAAFGCLLDKERTPILKALLDLDSTRILDYVIPGSSFRYLGAYPEVFDEESSLWDASHELALREASLYLGNFHAFRVLKGGETPNDLALHSAALMALPKFVEWLLDHGHDPNYETEEFDKMIPLALVCVSQAHLWCKIANEEGDLKTRQKQTIDLLALRTRCTSTWRHRNRTVLHIALENGLDVTKAMVNALRISTDPARDDRYLYKDKDGIEYSPHRYVAKFLDASDEVKNALTAHLNTEARMTSRYFRRIVLLPPLVPGGRRTTTTTTTTTTDQPPGYHGLPSEFT